MDYATALRNLNEAAHDAFKAAGMDSANAGDLITLLDIRKATDRLCDKPRQPKPAAMAAE